MTLLKIADVLMNPFRQGVADLLCLETLRHGTTWEGYFNIMEHGADPTLGGTKACQALLQSRKIDSYVKNSEGYFFVFRDSTVGTDFEGNQIDVFAKFDHEGHEQIGMGVKVPSLTCVQKLQQHLFVRFCPYFFSYLPAHPPPSPTLRRSFGAR